MKGITRAAAVIAASAGLFTTMAAGTASAGVWQQDFAPGQVPGGSAVGYARGGINFTNRAVQIQGSIKSGNVHCVQVQFFVFFENQVDAIANETRTACGVGPGSSRDFNFTVPANRRAGLRR